MPISHSFSTQGLADSAARVFDNRQQEKGVCRNHESDWEKRWSGQSPLDLHMGHTAARRQQGSGPKDFITCRFSIFFHHHLDFTLTSSL